MKEVLIATIILVIVYWLVRILFGKKQGKTWSDVLSNIIDWFI